LLAPFFWATRLCCAFAPCAVSADIHTKERGAVATTKNWLLLFGPFSMRWIEEGYGDSRCRHPLCSRR
jgi:hypothetical protein